MADDGRVESRAEPRADGARAERGIQYPADNLETAVGLLARVREAVGLGSASRETIAEALGYKGISGTSARRIGSLTHFDFLEKSGGGYRISDLGKSILMPTSDVEKATAIAEAVRRPSLYAALIEKYKNHTLPTLLANLLTREHGVFSGASEGAARTFRESVEFAGLLRNGVLHESPDVSASTADASPQAGETGSLRHATTVARPLGSTQAYTIALDNTGRLATIQIPVPVTQKDLRKVGAWIEYMSAVLDDPEAPSSGN